MLTAAIASGDTTSSAQLLAALQQTGVVKSIKQWSIPSDRVPDSADGLPDVVFLDLSRDPKPYFAFGAHLRRIRPSVRLIAVSAIVPPSHQLLLEAMRSGVQDFLPSRSSRKHSGNLSRFAQDSTEEQDRPSLDKLIVVMGSKGGVGTTTVAVNLGVQLSTFARKARRAARFRSTAGKCASVARSASEIHGSRRNRKPGPARQPLLWRTADPAQDRNWKFSVALRSPKSGRPFRCRRWSAS